MEELLCYFNGEYIRESEVKITLADMGIIEGGVYNLARTFNHTPFLWKEHIDRLFRSLHSLHIDPGLTREELYNITLEVFKRNEEYLAPEDDYKVIHRVTRGPMYFAPATGPTVLVHLSPMSPEFEQQAKYYREGIHLVVVSTRQIPPQCLDPKIKHTNRLCNSLAEFEAKMVDPEAYALMLDIRGFAAECPKQNFFMVKEGKLLTSKLTNCLGGITRTTILELAKELGIESAEADLTVYDLSNADEIFITATTFVIYPVAKFNNTPLGKPVPGPITQQLLSAFSKKVGIDIIQRAASYTQVRAKATRA